jgi:hypothetical protein
MKKYSWLLLLVFAMALITVCLLISKNEDVRGTFMKAAEEMPYFMAEARIFAEKALSARI